MGCQSGNAPNQAQKNGQPPSNPAEPTVPVDEDEVIFQLSAYLIAESGNKAEQQQNRIVNYAIDEMLPLEQTSSGLFYHIVRQGEGEDIEWGDYLSAHYKGYFLDGKEFDSSYRKESPMSFYVGNMIPAWNEALQLLKPGGKMLLIAPSQLAYAEKGVKTASGDYLVPPDEPLVFELEILERLEKGDI